MARINRKLLLFGIAALVLVGLVALNFKPKASARGVQVRVEDVRTHRIESWVRAPGKIQPVSKIQVSSNVMGRIEEVPVREGQRVRKGDLLLRLDDERYRSVVEQLRAQIQAGKAQEALAQAELREAEQSLSRIEKLSERGLASEQELTSARTLADVAAARVRAAGEDIQRARAALAQGEKDLRETIFLAPMDGVVTSLNVEVGENVITGTMNNPGTVILTLSDLSTIEVLAEVDETDVVLVRPGQQARVFVDALPDSTLEGEVTRVGQSGRGGTGSAQEATSFEVAVLLSAPPEALRPGMNADVEIMTGSVDSTLAVPLQALTARPPAVCERWKAKREGRKLTKDSMPDTTGPAARNLTEGVFLFEDGKARFVPVTLGLRGETHVQISGELTVGQKLIVGPYKTIRTLSDQDRVRLEKKKRGAKKKETETSDREP